MTENQIHNLRLISMHACSETVDGAEKAAYKTTATAKRRNRNISFITYILLKTQVDRNSTERNPKGCAYSLFLRFAIPYVPQMERLFC